MLNGDLSNVVAPRLIVVFEGAIGSLPESKVKDYEKAAKRNDWWRAVSYFELNELMLARILYLNWKSNFNISLVTWMPEEAAEAIDEMMSEHSIPVRGCFSSKPSSLARLLPYNPDIACIYDPVPEHILMFGSKGTVLTDANQIGRF